MSKKGNLIRILSAALGGVVASALTLPVIAGQIPTGTAVDVHTTITGLHEVPPGNPFPGLHLDAKVKGKEVDIYIAPMDFVRKYDVKVAKGQEVHLIGTEAADGNSDVVLTREITTGSIDRRTGIFRENMTIYLRNDDGPMW